LDIAFGSLRELEYQASLAHRLGYISDYEPLAAVMTESSKVLAALIRSLRHPKPTA
jgi:four helix bundle protein